MEKRDYCAVCDKPVSPVIRCKLADGAVVCRDCFDAAGYGMIVNPRTINLPDLLQRLGIAPTRPSDRPRLKVHTRRPIPRR